MKDVKITNIQPVAEPKGAQKPGRKEKTAGPSFDDALSDSLKNTVARLNDLNAQIQKEPAGKVSEADSASMKEEINAARENFDQMMLQKQNLARLYQRLTNKEDS
jgi:hypothetical protein